MDLFSNELESRIPITEGAVWLRGFALPVVDALWQHLTLHFEQYPPQQMFTPMGYKMSVRSTSMGNGAWVGTETGYRYAKVDFATKQNLPTIPPLFMQLASDAAKAAGYEHFLPDSCLVNCYDVGSKMGLHQDKDERDFTQPIVSVSLGIPATFLLGGAQRSDKTVKIPLTHGDVVVWGGSSRRYYHGVQVVKQNKHNLLGELRVNLTFRKAF